MPELPPVIRTVLFSKVFIIALQCGEGRFFAKPKVWVHQLFFSFLTPMLLSLEVAVSEVQLGHGAGRHLWWKLLPETTSKGWNGTSGIPDGTVIISTERIL